MQNAIRLHRRHARRGFVQQQDLGLQAQGNGNFHQALFAVGQIGDARSGIGLYAQQFEQRHGLVTHRLQIARGLPHPFGHSQTLRHAQCDVVEHRHLFEQGVDLKGAAQAPANPLGLGQGGDILSDNQHLAGGGAEPAREQIDKSGFASAIGADQGMARAHLELEIDVVGHGQSPKAFAQATGFQHGAHGAFPLYRADRSSTKPKMPPRANSTTKTSIRPMPKYQYSGNFLAR